MNETFLFWAAALLASLFVGGSKGGLPMIAQLSVPTVSLVMSPMQGAALLLPVYLISDAFGVWIYRRSFSARNLAILIPASAIGILAGYLLADRTSDNAVRVVIGCVGLGFLSMRLRNRFFGLPKPRKPDIARGVFWGSIAGFTSFVSHAGGAALQAYTLPQQMPKMMFAGTATILFATINMMKVPPYLALGLIEFDNLRTLLALGPVAILGTWIGYRLTKLIPEKTFFVIVEIALFLVSVNLIRLGLTG